MSVEDPAAGGCAGTLVGTTYTLTADCNPTEPLTVPDGHTLNGGGFTITAAGNVLTNGWGPILSNAGASMNVTNLTINGELTSTGTLSNNLCPTQAPAPASCLMGILFNDASGSVSGVTVTNISLGTGNPFGQGIFVRADTPQTVNITDTTVSGYQKGGITTQGPETTTNISDSTIGPAAPLSLISTGVLYGGEGPAGFLLGGSGTVSNSTIFGRGFASPALPYTVDAAVSLLGAGQVTLQGNNITGDGTDVGINVLDGTKGTVIDHNHIARTAPNTLAATDLGIGVNVDTSTGSSATLTCNTFAGWITDVNGIPPQAPCPGYWLAGSDGGVFAFGDATFSGSMGGVPLNAPVVGIASTPGGGYWLAASDGGVFAFGLPFFGSMGGMHLNSPIVGIAATNDAAGYYLVAADGGVFAFGDAQFFGSMGGMHLNKPVVGMAVTADNQGYYLVASDGGVFAFGDAQFRGSMAGMTLDAPVVGMAEVPQDHSYWLVASDGGVFAFDAPFFGSAVGLRLDGPIVGLAPEADGGGYNLAASDGGVFSFGDAQFLGSMGGKPLHAPIVGIATTFPP